MMCKKCGADTWVGVETSLCDKCKKELTGSKTATGIVHAYDSARESTYRKLRAEAEFKDAPRAIDDLIEMILIQNERIQSLIKERDEQTAAAYKLTIDGAKMLAQRDEARLEAVQYRNAYCAKSQAAPMLPWEKVG